MTRLLFLLILLLPLVACERQEKDTTPKTSAGQAAVEKGTAGRTGQKQGGEEKVPYPIDLQQGEKVYREVCATCHREGIAGAPKMGDKEAWQPRIAKGLPTLVENSINGYQGNQGVMPPKGGAKSLSNQQVASAVAYIVRQNR